MLLSNLYLFFVVVKYGDPAYYHVRHMASGKEQFNVKFCKLTFNVPLT